MTRVGKNLVTADRPYAFFAEEEADGSGGTARVATIFLTASECPLSCTMCDLWRNTLDGPTPNGKIPQQIEAALSEMSDCDWIKLYNSGNFFDANSIPPADHDEIVRLCESFSRVIIENHPKFTSPKVVEFANRLNGKLEVAMGLETIEPGLLDSLNKGMTIDDFKRSAEFFANHDIDTRAFVILAPPGGDPLRSVDWAKASANFAVQHGVRHVAVIPQRWKAGHIALSPDANWSQPTATMLEKVLDDLLPQEHSVVTVDLWDWDRLAPCADCSDAKRLRLTEANLRQKRLPSIECPSCQA